MSITEEEEERERKKLQMRERSIIIKRTADPDGDARKYAARQLFNRLEYRLLLLLLLCLRYYPNANRVNYRLAARRLTADSALLLRYYETELIDITSSSPNVKLKDCDSQTSSPDEGSNMEYGQSTLEYVCSKCGSRPTTSIKIEERVIESTCEIIEETSYESCLRYYKDDDFRRVPFPEAGVDIVDRKLKNTQESLEKEINDEHEDDILTYTESWTDNWLFRKKDDKTTKNEDTTMKPVAMFVPNTTAKYRAMIGDRDVDEMSDLSECSNNEDDDDDEELVTGKDSENGVAKYIYDSRALLLLDGKSKHHRDTSNGYCRENTKGIDDVESNRSYRSELFIESYCDNDVNHQNTELMSDNDKLSDIDFNLFSPPRPGTIADREHRKWLTAAPMENNPYSEENLQKRLLERKYIPKYSSLLGHARTNGYDDGLVVDNIDFESIDLPEKSSTPIAESTRIDVVEEEEKSAEKSNDNDDDDTKNTSNSETIAVTKKNARRRINDDCTNDEKISLPSVRKLVEIFSAYQRKRGINVKPTKDKNTTVPEVIKFERSQPRPLHLHSLTARSLSKEFREGLR